MSLKNILDKNVNKHKKEGDITEERLMKILPELRNLISFFREYPDYFVDFIKGEDSTFEFLFYQRLWLRCMVRYKNFYGVAPRAFAKSFLAMMGKILQATLYPNSDLFITTGGKRIAAY